MNRYYAHDFFYAPKSKFFHGSTRVLEDVREEDIVIIGRTKAVQFNYIGADEGFDEVVGECLAYFYKSECGNYFARITVV